MKKRRGKVFRTRPFAPLNNPAAPAATASKESTMPADPYAPYRPANPHNATGQGALPPATPVEVRTALPPATPVTRSSSGTKTRTFEVSVGTNGNVSMPSDVYGYLGYPPFVRIDAGDGFFAVEGCDESNPHRFAVSGRRDGGSGKFGGARLATSGRMKDWPKLPVRVKAKKLERGYGGRRAIICWQHDAASYVPATRVTPKRTKA